MVDEVYRNGFNVIINQVKLIVDDDFLRLETGINVFLENLSSDHNFVEVSDVKITGLDDFYVMGLIRYKITKNSEY